LEFLGDAVLDLVIAEELFVAHPDWEEGELTRARAQMVNTKALAVHTRRLGFHMQLRLGKTELQTGGVDKDSILGNLFEALIGALYLDGGLSAVSHFVRAEFAEGLASNASEPERDVKTRFQEWAHASYHCTPRYRMLSDSGVDDDPERFLVEVALEDRVLAQGVGRSKRIAERDAASNALRAEVGEDV
jgi:ribonuclease-3